MIFLTLGTQLPFDRLVQALDEVAPDVQETVIAQVGYGEYKPKHFSAVDMMPPDEFERTLSEARIVVSHAGIGTLLTGLKYEKPLVVMARRADFNEHRNNHQLATVAEISQIEGVYVAENAKDIKGYLEKDELQPLRQKGMPRRDSLVHYLKQQISGENP